MGNKKKRKKKKRKTQSRSIVVMQMILHCKGGFMHDRRKERGGAKNKQDEIFKDSER